MLTVGSLFAGIGGLDLGLEWAGLRVVWQVENDPWCVHLLERHWPDVRRFGDVAAVDPAQLGPADVVAGGFPCQPISRAGHQLAQADPRWLWPEFARIVRGVRPRYVVVENVPALRTINGGSAFGDVVGELAASGYDTEWDGLSAANVGAPHRRDRVWVIARRADLADPQGQPIWTRLRPRGSPEVGGRRSGHGGGPPSVADPVGPRLERHPRHDQDPPGRAGPERPAGPPGLYDRIDPARWWAAEPSVGRVANGLPRRVDRLRVLGNAVVPEVAQVIGELIMADSLARARGDMSQADMPKDVDTRPDHD